MQRDLQKVTGLVTRASPSGPQLLLLKHPYAGIQLPAGTVEVGETSEAAVLREVYEETGLEAVQLEAYIGLLEEQRANHRFVLEQAKVYARPDTTSFAWASLRRGIVVRWLRESEHFVHVSYEEWDQLEQPQYITYQITGWVLRHTLTTTRRRHFYHLTFDGHPSQTWYTFTDHHTFHPFWAPLNKLPELVSPQNEWLRYVEEEIGYSFA